MTTCFASTLDDLAAVDAVVERPLAGALQIGDRRLTASCAVWLATAALSLIAGCYDITHARNPGFCCEDPARCQEWGAPGPVSCEAPGEVCEVAYNYCVPTECSSDAECTDPARAICTRGLCKPCADDLACAPFEGSPICDGGTCRACRPGDCVSGVCDPDVGTCADEVEVAYIAKRGEDSGSCSRAAPCLTIGRGLAQLGARRFLLIAASPEPYAEAAAAAGAGVSITDKIVTILGEGATLTTTRYGDTALRVTGIATVVVDGLRIANASGPAGDGVACQNAGQSSPMLTLRRVEVTSNGGRGISATSCNLVLDRSTVTNNSGRGIDTNDSTVAIERSMIMKNMGGGVATSGGTVTVRNNMIASNGSAVSVYGGVSLSQISAAASLTFAFNTITGNVGIVNARTGVDCAQVFAPLTLSNNIVYGNQVAGSGAQVGGANCAFTYSDVGPQSAPGVGNISADPLFVDPANGNCHLRASSPAKDAADPGATLDVDIDGDRRPQGGRADMGADEALAAPESFEDVSRASWRAPAWTR